MNRLTAITIASIVLSACSSLLPEPEVHTPISSKPAVIDLLDTAHTHLRFDEYAQAKYTIERALRIEPQNAYLWFELAKVHRDQGKHPKAKNLALRAQSFAKDSSLKNTISRFITSL